MSEKIKVMVGMPVPMDYKVNLLCAMHCGYWQANKYIDFCGKVIHETDGARNLVIKDFLKSDCTHLFFVDSDTVPPLSALNELVMFDKDIACGVTPMHILGKGCWSVSKILNPNGTIEWLTELPAEPFKIKATGGTTIMVKRNVIEKIGWPWFLTVYNENGDRIGEDVNFCRKVNEAGFNIWCLPNIKCRHFQTRDLGEILSLWKL